MTDIPETFLERLVRSTQARVAQWRAWFETYAGAPARKVFGILARLFSWYRRRIWKPLATDRTGRTRPGRGAATLAGTILAIWMIPGLLFATWQTGFLLLTGTTETIYLSAAEEIDPEADLHAIRGCRAMPCQEADAIYFRVRPTLVHDLYALTTRGSLFYPDYVASVVAPGVNKCEVHSYGLRIRALMRGWGIYPDMLDATCTPYETDRYFPQGTAAGD